MVRTMNTIFLTQDILRYRSYAPFVITLPHQEKGLANLPRYHEMPRVSTGASDADLSRYGQGPRPRYGQMATARRRRRSMEWDGQTSQSEHTDGNGRRKLRRRNQSNRGGSRFAGGGSRGPRRGHRSRSPSGSYSSRGPPERRDSRYGDRRYGRSHRDRDGSNPRYGRSGRYSPTGYPWLWVQIGYEDLQPPKIVSNNGFYESDLRCSTSQDVS